MPISSCRVCGKALFEGPLLHFGNMPSSAQNFPGAASLSSETGAELAVRQCSGCGLVQLENDPVPYYKEVIRAAAVSPVLRDLKTGQFAEFIRKYSLRGKKIVEIGCGRGEFLGLLPALGVEAFGLEHSEAAVRHCAENGLKAYRGYPDGEMGKLAAGPFDAFLLLMFLEHMPDPNSALKALAANLKEGAVGLVEVPNFDMLVRAGLFSEFIADHLLYFTRETFLTTLNLNGFEVLDCAELRDGYVLSAEVRKRTPLDLSGFTGRQAEIKAALHTFLGRFGERKVAVWGAGHQALAVLALAGLGDKVRYVVDSAPFKQGKYTPATHLPVVPPDALRSDPVEAVIVMAASYSDEVAGLLRRDFPPALKVAILRERGLEIRGA